MVGNKAAEIGSMPLIDLGHSVICVDQKNPSSIFPATLLIIQSQKTDFLKLLNL